MKPLLPLTLAILLATPTFAETPQVPTSTTQIALSFAPVVKQTAPAVVNIYVSQIVQDRPSPFAGDPFFEEFFQNFGPSTPRVQNSLGSGVIVSPDGIVVSNYHVVGEATKIRVVLNDRREYDATVMLADEQSDLAVLKLDGAADLPVITLRDSDTVEVGELVLAIGNPFGVGQTVSSGIVSGLARSSPLVGNGHGYFIQTDAAINPGNSGGALVDTAGQLVGINTAILSKSGGSLGIGFAIPSNLVTRVVEQARAGATRFQRPWAGVTGQAVDASLAEAMGLAGAGGRGAERHSLRKPLRQGGHPAGRRDPGPCGTAHEHAGGGVFPDGGAWRRRGGRGALQPPGDGEHGHGPPDRGTGCAASRYADVAGRRCPARPDGGADQPGGGRRVGPANAVRRRDRHGGGRPRRARAGLQPGDIILAINGQLMTTTADVESAAAQRTRLWQVDVNRQGQGLRLRFRL